MTAVVLLTGVWPGGLDPSAYRASTENPNPYRTGIGINTVPEQDGLRVVIVFDGSPAAHAGLMRGDLIVKVGSTSLADRPDDSGLELILSGRAHGGGRGAVTQPVVTIATLVVGPAGVRTPRPRQQPFHDRGW